MAERAARMAQADLQRPVPEQVEALLGWLERTGTKRYRKGMARYAIPSDKAFGVPVGVRGRSCARDTGPDGPLVPRIRQLGHL
jgi:hypothetical protein